MKPKLAWYLRFGITVALLFVPSPWKERFRTILDAYDQLPDGQAAVAHDHVVSVLELHGAEPKGREGVGNSPDTMKE